MGTEYFTKRRINHEVMEIDGEEVTVTLDTMSASTEDENDASVLTIVTDAGRVSISAHNARSIIGPLVEALRVLLSQSCMSEDELDDSWSKP